MATAKKHKQRSRRSNDQKERNKQYGFTIIRMHNHNDSKQGRN